MDEETFTCWTAPGVVFPTRTEMYDHYRTDWHRYNLRRKVAGMPPVTWELFERLQAASEARAKGVDPTHKQDHVKVDKREKARRKAQLKKENVTPKPAPSTPAAAQVDAPAAPPADTNELGESVAAMAVDGEEPEEETGEFNFDKAAFEKEFDVCESIFDGKVSATLEDNLLYMQRDFGFFIPDAEYVGDFPGLFQYCIKKVHVANLCLKCGKRFKDVTATQGHMKSLFHCKIKWEDDYDMEEYDDFYDFSSTWGDLPPMSEASEGATEEEIKEMLAAREVQRAGKSSSVTMEMASTGELLFHDSGGVTRRIGVREFRQAYKQNIPMGDQRESVVASSKERMLRVYRSHGIDTSSMDESTLSSLSQLQFTAPKTGSGLVAKEMKVRARDLRAKQWSRNRQGRTNNLLIKNMVAGKAMGAGWGVHG